MGVRKPPKLCELCGNPALRQRNRFCSPACWAEHMRRTRWGAANPHWVGDSASENGKRQRAHRRFSAGLCEKCGGARGERHHKDGDPGNNVHENIAVLCRRCHMTEDGRITSRDGRGRFASRSQAIQAD